MTDTYPMLPVQRIPSDAAEDDAEPGMALCLSGGGFRAMLFHVGALWRLNEFGLLSQMKRISSVSGGSITNGVLGLAWKNLAFDGNGVATRFEHEVVRPIRAFADRTFDWRAILMGSLLPGNAGDQMIDFYRDRLYGQRTLQDLPDEATGEGPRFIINATNLQSGVLWRFSRPYQADYRVGRQFNPMEEIAVAVAASAGFPPLLSPVKLTFGDGELEEEEGNDLHEAPYTRRVELADGGIYDNLGLETVLKKYRTVFVSDGGGRLGPQPDPPDDWPRQVRRVLDVIDSQVRALRRRLVIEAYKREAGTPGAREGAYWGIWTKLRPCDLAGILPCDPDLTTELARTPTRLAEIDPLHQERLINWGYAACDANVRCWYDRSLPPPADFPYPAAGVG